MNNKKIEKWKLYFGGDAEVSVAGKVKTIPAIIDQVARNLSKLVNIQYIRILTDRIEASNITLERGGGTWKQPITEQGHPTAIGISLIFDSSYKTVSVFSITSAEKGNGSKMVEAVIDGLEEGWELVVMMDWSSGFWDKMIEKYPQAHVY